MNLESYISQLLYRYQCVIVPGFGAFLTENQPAQRNDQTHSFSPPKKSISFNALVKNNDGLLANHIIKSERISYETAVNYINFEVENWNAKLEEIGQITIKNIGDFYLNADRKIIFEPFAQNNFLTDSFGLNTILSPEIERFTEEATYIEKPPIQSQTAATIVPLITNEIKMPQQKSQYLKYAAILIVSCGLGVMGANALYTEHAKVVNLEYELHNKVEQQVENKIQTATFFISNPLRKVVKTKTVKTVLNATENLNYHVVAGVYAKQANGQKQAKKLIALGYNAKVLPANEKGSYTVIYNSYSSMDEAKKAEIEIKKNQPDAWILTQKLK